MAYNGGNSAPAAGLKPGRFGMEYALDEGSLPFKPDAEFQAPTMTTIKYYWEDLTPGWEYESPPRTLSAQQITTFAHEYDPQSYHTDEQAAKSSPFGGLIASGWQTCSVAMRLMCDGYLLQTSCIGSPGLD